MARLPSHGALLITAPTEDQRLYEMSVRITRAEYGSPQFERLPWLKIRAELSTGDVFLSAGVKVRRKPSEDDGA